MSKSNGGISREAFQKILKSLNCIHGNCISTEIQKRFWASNHKANIAQAMIAFSPSEYHFKELAKRKGYRRAWRNRMWEAFGHLVNTPSMDTPEFQFFELEDKYWDVMPNNGDHPQIYDDWSKHKGG